MTPTNVFTRVMADVDVTPTTEKFTVSLPDWDPWGGAGCFGTLEMDSWELTLLHDTNAAAAAGVPCWVLSVDEDTPRTDQPLTAVRYTGGPLDPYRTPGLLVPYAGELRLANETFTDWSCSSVNGFSDLVDVDDWLPAQP